MKYSKATNPREKTFKETVIKRVIFVLPVQELEITKQGEI